MLSRELFDSWQQVRPGVDQLVFSLRQSNATSRTQEWLRKEIAATPRWMLRMIESDLAHDLSRLQVHTVMYQKVKSQLHKLDLESCRNNKRLQDIIPYQRVGDDSCLLWCEVEARETLRRTLIFLRMSYLKYAREYLME